MASPKYYWTLQLYNGTPYSEGSYNANDSSTNFYRISPQTISVTASAGPVGPIGPGGPQGSTGPAGSTGIQGPTGPQGPASSATNGGPTGAQGSTGPRGSTGSAGSVGVQGAVGSRGPTPTGDAATGIQGPVGIQGATGPAGSTGIQGSVGIQGATGSRGSIGIRGVTGPQGSTGTIAGSTGPTGSVGIVGMTGSTGAVGVRGVTGSTGIQASSAATGIQGTRGIAGATGITGAPFIESNQGWVVTYTGGNVIFTHEDPGYSVTFPSSGTSGTYVTCTSVSVNDGAAVDGATWASSVAGQTVSDIKTILLTGVGNIEVYSDKAVTWNNLTSPTDIYTNGTFTSVHTPGSGISGGETIKLTFLENTTFTKFYFKLGSGPKL